MDRKEKIMEILSLNGVYFGIVESITDQILDVVDVKSNSKNVEWGTIDCKLSEQLNFNKR